MSVHLKTYTHRYSLCEMSGPILAHRNSLMGASKQDTWRTRCARKLRINNRIVRGFLAEFLATFAMIVFASTAGVSNLARSSKFNIPPGSNILMICIIQGAAVTFAIYIAGGITGGFLNPAVTVAWTILGRLNWKNCIAYCIAEYLGAFCASGITFLTFYDLFFEARQSGPPPSYPIPWVVPTTEHLTVDGNTTLFGAGVAYHDYKNTFGTYPRDGISLVNAWIDQIVCSMMLLIGVLAVSDRRNWRPPDGLFPIIVGLMVMTVNLGFNFNTGSAMNPARDLSPRLFSYLIGMGPGIFEEMDYMWFLVPILGSHAGAILGAMVYVTFIEVHWPETPKSIGNRVRSELSESSAVLTATKTVMPDSNESYPHPVQLLEENVPGRVDHSC
ncbi:aquaporin-2-like [Paramacrobiotus metropolitanus]|uniref:aquaporin-2-like n=1 Tax=Paramacrobiotus metropolitanus TaxID=2943436 RepID=UPI0024465191|nr:aquaporin-2-like [Paramacrobiotus metropolitanus]